MEFGLLKSQVKSKFVLESLCKILPTRDRLSERGIDIDTQCPLCDEEVETPVHALRDCRIASEVLSIAHLALVPLASQYSSVQAWLPDRFRHLSKESFSILLMLLWAIWRNRNSQVWDEVSQSAAVIVPITLGWWEEFRSAHVSSHAPRQPILQKWKKPSAGFVKLNVDASFNLASRRAGLGGVFRDSQGVKEACSRHLVPLIVESDCLNIVQALHSNSLDNSVLGYLIGDLRQLLLTAFAASLIHVRRSANGVAHILARDAGVNHPAFEFLSVAPPFVEAAISFDCTIN
ncbi:hypothetical protein M0R45_020161 [Rubus argutus]|uniref:RNase H type-1 domain-containing protein n=1 Tax=Rubus argutus TaxID=59490 RepID=A0AAW1XAV8_RUBAR